jgi:transcriptional regulator with XRE-family HTH domain/anti-sigma regulatory factor (Ser/Thr protein kinase)
MSAEIIPLGTRLRQRREELGLSQAQAARELEVARTAYRLWEMEAARPAPDRWRVIAKWLGMSVTALLLAGELLDEQEAMDAERTVLAAGLTSEGWDQESDTAGGDFFSQERAMIADQASAGKISSLRASHLRELLARVQDATMTRPPGGWHPGRFVKRLPSTDLAPCLARAAFVATAVGIPTDVFANAELLTSELVTNSVRHADSEWIEIDIMLTTDRLRIDVCDQSDATIRPRTPSMDGGWGLALMGEIADRWGVERLNPGKKIWIEFDLRPQT